MTDFKTVLKSNIKTVDPKISKRNVKIVCLNKNAGTKVISTINQNTDYLFGGYKINKIATGGGDKDFTVKMEIRDGAQYFYDTLMAVLNDSTVPVVEPEKSGAENFAEKAKTTINNITEKIGGFIGGGESSLSGTSDMPLESSDMPDGMPAGSQSEGTDNKKIMIIGGAVLLVIILALVIWKLKK